MTKIVFHVTHREKRKRKRKREREREREREGEKRETVGSEKNYLSVYACIHVCVCTCVFVFVCVQVHVCVRECVSTGRQWRQHTLYLASETELPASSFGFASRCKAATSSLKKERVKNRKKKQFRNTTFKP